MNAYKVIRFLKSKEFVILAALYFIFACGYYVALYINGKGYKNPMVFLDYALKAIVTVPFWFLFFRVLRKHPLWMKIVLHIPMSFLFAWGWQQIYYVITEAIGQFHLYGPAAVWDIYIPILFYVLQFGMFHVYDYYQKLKVEELRAIELREVALKNELSALKAQISPHFLYNTFNAINASLPPGNEQTRELIATLSDLFRYQLKASKSEFVTLAQECEFVQNYLSLEQARFGDRLQVDFNIDAAVNHCLIPPITIQPLVENAVKHGISPKIEGGQVTILAFRQMDKLHIEILDTGVGFKNDAKTKGEGVGLNNIERRLQLAFGESLHIKSDEQKGTHISFKIPIMDKQPHLTKVKAIKTSLSNFDNLSPSSL